MLFASAAKNDFGRHDITTKTFVNIMLFTSLFCLTAMFILYLCMFALLLCSRP